MRRAPPASDDTVSPAISGIIGKSSHRGIKEHQSKNWRSNVEIMNKTRVFITRMDDMIHFYLRCNKGTAYLFSQRFSKGVYLYFRFGRSDSELHKFHGWGQNPRLDHTIDKCLNPSYRRYAMNELSA